MLAHEAAFWRERCACEQRAAENDRRRSSGSASRARAQQAVSLWSSTATGTGDPLSRTAARPEAHRIRQAVRRYESDATKRETMLSHIRDLVSESQERLRQLGLQETTSETRAQRREERARSRVLLEYASFLRGEADGTLPRPDSQQPMGYRAPPAPRVRFE